MKALKNILGILLLLVFLLANANPNHRPVIDRDAFVNQPELQVEAYIYQNQLVIKLDESPDETIEVEIYDLTGKRVDLQSLEVSPEKEYTLPFGTVLGKGLYLVKLTIDGKTTVKKVHKT